MTSGRSFLLAAMSLIAGIFFLSWAETLLRSHAYPWLFREQLIPLAMFLLSYFTAMMWINLFGLGDAILLFCTIAILFLYIRLTLKQKKAIYKIIFVLALGGIYINAANIEQSLVSPYFPLLCLVVVAATIPWDSTRRSRWMARTKEVGIKFALTYIKLCLFIGWWILALFSPAYSLIPIMIYYFLMFIGSKGNEHRQVIIGKHAYVFASVCTCLLLAGALYAENIGANRIKATRIFPHPAFDTAVHDDSTVIALERKSGIIPGDHEKVQAYFHRDGSWRSIPYTNNPERLVYDSKGRKTYIGNFWSGPNEANVAVFDGRKTSPLYLAGCVSSIDLRIVDSRRELLVLCEGSSSLHFVNLDTLQELASIILPSAMTYSLAVDEKRRRAYVANHGIGWLSVIDLDNRTIIQKRRASACNLNMIVDKATGNIWMSNPSSNSVVVFDPDLNFLDRIPVGIFPRDILVDSSRDIVIVGKYLRGALAFISLSDRRSLGYAYLTSLPPIQRLAGLFLGSAGEIYLSKNDGVWKITEPELSSLVDRKPQKEMGMAAEPLSTAP